jgi:plasmid stabilization system protein ParE
MKHPSYRVTVLEPAARDVQTQFDYIHGHSPTGAFAWYESYLRALDRLKRDPAGPGIAPENNHVEEEIRQVFFKTRRGHVFRILYTIAGDQVRVLRVRGMGQDLLGPKELG